MFTLCWSNEDEEGWDILSSKKELQTRVHELMNQHSCSPEDMMIFTNNYLVPEENGEVLF